MSPAPRDAFSPPTNPARDLSCPERLDRVRAYVMLMRELREGARDRSPNAASANPR